MPLPPSPAHLLAPLPLYLPQASWFPFIFLSFPLLGTVLGVIWKFWSKKKKKKKKTKKKKVKKKINE